MTIKKFNQFPENSGTISSDDILLFMDDPSGNGTTKKISLSELSSAIGIAPSATFKITSVDLHNGGVQNAQVLEFDNNSYQSVITGPIPSSGNNAQRIIIQGRRGQGNGEGGDVYLWGGDSDSNGGDIKIYAGDADNNESPSYGGYINIDAGNGYDNGGNLSLSAGNSTNNGGNVYISAGNGGSSHGIVNIATSGGSRQWTFNSDGQLVFPNYTTVAVGTFDNGTGGNNGISLNCYVGYELNWQGGHLKSTQDNGTSAANIYCDSAIEFPGSETNNMEINSSGLIFPNNTVQTSAGIPSNTGVVPNSTSITNIVAISQSDYDSIVTKDPNTLYIVS